MPVQDLPCYMISPSELAEWLDRQPGIWWHVDGDPLLTARLDLPCPGDELAAELRKLQGKRLFVADSQNQARAICTEISWRDFGKLADTHNRHAERNFLLRWGDGGDFWLLTEDKDASENSAA